MMLTMTRALKVLLSLALLGAVLTAVARFGYLAHVIVERGASLDSVPFLTLAFEVMRLHLAALYGALGGLLLGAIVVLVDIVRFRPREPLRWHETEIGELGGDDLVKSTRAKVGDEYLARRRRDRETQGEA